MEPTHHPVDRARGATERRASDVARNALATCRALLELDEAIVGAIRERCSEKSFEAGEALIRQGEPGDSLVFLVEGTAFAEVADGEGTRRRVGEFEANDVVGEMSLLTGNPCTADVIAGERCSALVLNTEDFDELIAAYPQLAVVLTYLVAERLGQKSADGLGGKEVDRYRIVRCVGRGGMAVVYEARELESLEPVALKMMSHRLVYNPGALARFQREADVLFALDHVNIARVGRRFPAYRTYFISMEYCDGGDLKGLVHRGYDPDEKELRRLIGQLAAGLGYLHSRGVVHRDLKPQNVLATRAGVLKLADFGLATNVSPDAPETMGTPAGAIMGTPYYMAPEQMEGVEASFESDLYGLGCVLLEVLTGKAPFHGSGLLEVIRKKSTFSMPPRRVLGVSRKLYSILRACLATAPEKRVVDLASIARWAGPLSLSPELFPSDPG